MLKNSTFLELSDRNIVSPARSNLHFTFYFGSHFESEIEKVRENPVLPGSRAV